MLKEQEEETNQLYHLLDYDDDQAEHIINQYVIDHHDKDPFCTVKRFHWMTQPYGNDIDWRKDIEWRFYDRTTKDLFDCLVADGIVEDRDKDDVWFVFRSRLERYLNEHCSSYIEFGCAY